MRASGHGKEITVETALKIFPGFATVVSAENDSLRSYRKAPGGIGKSNRIEPFLQVLIHPLPRLAGVYGPQDRSV
jgi:hypothetical protein